MGAVFRAYDKRAPDRPWVAVKVAQLHGTDEDRVAKERAFAREVRAAAALSEYIKYFVGFRAADYNGKPAYLALDFIDWPTLKKLKAQTGIFPPSDVAKIGSAILRGIRWMERKNIVHRDLKPENIFARRSPDGSFEAKIADLGVWVDAGTTEDSLWNSTDVPQVVGSPSYMSPEQVRGDALSTASDVHALGSILFELATGTVPFPLNYSLSLLEAVRERHERMRDLPVRPANMPESLYWILSSALSFDPAKRIFTDSNVSHSPDPSIARWMEKALDKFATDHAEQQRQALAAALDRLVVLDRSITSSEAKLTPAFLLADRVKQIRSRIGDLRDDTVEGNLPEAVSVLSAEVDGIAQEVAQLFEDREVRQALARAQHDLAREDARLLRDIEREGARREHNREESSPDQTAAKVSRSRSTSTAQIAETASKEAHLARGRSLLAIVAVAACLVAGFALGSMTSGRHEKSAAVAGSTGPAAPGASIKAVASAATSIATISMPGSASPASSVEVVPDAGQITGSEPDSGSDVASTTGAAAAAGQDAIPQENGARPKQAVIDIYDDPITPGKSGSPASPTVVPVPVESAPILPKQAAPFDSSAAASALGAAANSVSSCKKEGDPSGGGLITVTFATSGNVTSAVITGGALVGTTTGGCVARLFRGAKIPAFDGPPHSIQGSFTVP
jgi:serine/threonine protein kinase